MILTYQEFIENSNFEGDYIIIFQGGEFKIIL